MVGNSSSPNKLNNMNNNTPATVQQHRNHTWSLWNDLLNKKYVDVENIWAVSSTATIEHLFTVLITMGLFLVLFFITYTLLYVLIKPRFTKVHVTKRLQYEAVLSLNANLHHLIVSTCIMYTMLYMCAPWNGDTGTAPPTFFQSLEIAALAYNVIHSRRANNPTKQGGSSKTIPWQG